MMDNKKIVLLGVVLLFSIFGHAQINSIYQNASFQPYDRYLYNADNRFHTSVKPYDMGEVWQIVNIDSLYTKDCKNKYVKHLLNNDIIRYRSKDFNFNTS